MNEPPDLLFLLRRIEGRLGRIEDRLSTIERDIVRLSHEAAGTHSECRDIRHRLTRVEQKLGLYDDPSQDQGAPLLRDFSARPNPKAIPKMSNPRKPIGHHPPGGHKPDALEYGGYRLAMRSHGDVGWKVFIYPPGGVTALETMPHSQAPDSRDAMIAEAMQVADRHHTRRR